ncbi:MAG: GNAT family N-acetyltransferase [Acidimicrobiia bacterium]
MTRPSASTVLVRSGTAADFDAWLALYEAVAGERLWMGAEAPLDPVVRREFFDRALTEAGAAIFVAEGDGRLVGAVNLTLGRGLVDLGMFVAGDRRGAGVGGALVEAAIGWAREAGAHKVALTVWAHNLPARGLYATYGFKTEGVRRRHYRRRSGELWDAFLMGLVLDETSPGGPGAERRPPPVPVTLPAGGIAAGRLVLRPWRAADVPDIPAAVDPEIHRRVDTIPYPYTLADAEEFVAITRQGLTEGRAANLAITGDGRLLGAIGVRRAADPGVGELGYWVAAGARGRGVASAAAGALTEWAFDGLGLHRVELYTATDNAAARAAAERAGFEFEGIRRSWRKVHGQPTDYAAYARLPAVRATPTRTPRTT